MTQRTNTQNDVLNEPGFILSLVLQHAEVIFGNGRRRRLLRCERNIKAINVEKLTFIVFILFKCTVLPFCDVSRLFI